MFANPRDLYAAFALAGLLAWSPEDHDTQYSAEDAARIAYRHADAMLLERDRATPTVPAAPPEVPPAGPEATAYAETALRG